MSAIKISLPLLALFLLYLFSLYSISIGDDLFALPPEVICGASCSHKPLNNIGPSRLWVPLFGIVFHLKSAFLHGISPARITSSLKLLFSPGPGLGAPLSSYLEMALYKFHRSAFLKLWVATQKWVEKFCQVGRQHFSGNIYFFVIYL